MEQQGRFQFVVTFVIRKRLSCPMNSTSGLLFIIVLTLLRGKRTSFDLRGELAATVVGVVVAESSATLGLGVL